MARLLLIDDDRNVLDMLAMALEDAGHSLILASNGLEGHKRAIADDPDLIVSDVNMPGLDGFSLCRRLRDAGDSREKGCSGPERRVGMGTVADASASERRPSFFADTLALNSIFPVIWDVLAAAWGQDRSQGLFRHRITYKKHSSVHHRDKVAAFK